MSTVRMLILIIIIMLSMHVYPFLKAFCGIFYAVVYIYIYIAGKNLLQ